MKKILSLICMFLFVQAYAQDPTSYYIELKTSKGDLMLKLYNETPQHRDNFKKLVKEGFYDSLLFHRVINNFMIQGGDSQSKNASANAVLGSGSPSYKVPAEIRADLFHKKGALGAARDNNPEKESSASQFYIVHGRTFTNAGLDSLQELRMKGVKFSAQQRQAYTSIGGTPHLDGNYTVFGEVIDGLTVVDSIAKVQTNDKDRPSDDVRMQARLLTRREAINKERQINGLKPKNGLFTRIGDLFKSKEYIIK